MWHRPSERPRTSDTHTHTHTPHTRSYPCPDNHSNALEDAWPKRVRCGPPSLGNPEAPRRSSEQALPPLAMLRSYPSAPFSHLPPYKAQAKTSASVKSHEKLSTLQVFHTSQVAETSYSTDFIHTHENKARAAANLSTELGQRSVPATEAAWSRGRPGLDSAEWRWEVQECVPPVLRSSEPGKAEAGAGRREAAGSGDHRKSDIKTESSPGAPEPSSITAAEAQERLPPSFPTLRRRQDQSFLEGRLQQRLHS